MGNCAVSVTDIDTGILDVNVLLNDMYLFSCVTVIVSKRTCWYFIVCRYSTDVIVMLP